ncbi:MAG: HPr family phosphocarrier protein [Fibrobacter sp.]|nr:HPr family phosphocarrier protein [Fibrobacter sp.]
MITKKFIINESQGLHARPAMVLSQKCQQFISDVVICKGCQKADGCSIIELLLLNAKQGTEVVVSISGDDEKTAVDVLTDFFEHGSGI